MPPPSFLARLIALLLGREGRSLHARAAAGAALALGAATLLGSWAVVAAEADASRANLTTYPRALWWSVETATTVGYGDFYPVTFWGRVIACLMMFVGITTYGMVTAALATWFVGRDRERRRRLSHAVGEGLRHGEQRLESDARALHERFDRLERLLRTQEARAGARGGDGPRVEGGGAPGPGQAESGEAGAG